MSGRKLTFVAVVGLGLKTKCLMLLRRSLATVVSKVARRPWIAVCKFSGGEVVSPSIEAESSNYWM